MAINLGIHRAHGFLVLSSSKGVRQSRGESAVKPLTCGLCGAMAFLETVDDESTQWAQWIERQLRAALLGLNEISNPLTDRVNGNITWDML